MGTRHYLSALFISCLSSCGSDDETTTYYLNADTGPGTLRLSNSDGQNSGKTFSGNQKTQAELLEKVDETAWKRCREGLEEDPKIVMIRANQPITDINFEGALYLEIHANQPITHLNLESKDEELVGVPKLCILVRANQPNTKISLDRISVGQLDYEVHANQPHLDVDVKEGAGLSSGRIETHTNQSHIEISGPGALNCEFISLHGSGNQNQYQCEKK